MINKVTGTSNQFIVNSTQATNAGAPNSIMDNGSTINDPIELGQEIIQKLLAAGDEDSCFLAKIVDKVMSLFSKSDKLPEKKEFLNAINEIIKSRSQITFNVAALEYYNKTGKSFVAGLYTSGAITPGSKLETTLKYMCNKNSMAGCDFLANDLRKALNGRNENEIKTLLDNINATNVQKVYTFYFASTTNYGEIAATDEEIQRLDNSYFKRVVVKTRAKRTETLLQGVLKNEALSLEEKREYLTKITNYLIQNAKKQGIAESKIAEFSAKAEKNIQQITKDSSSWTQNSYLLEDYVGDLFGWKKS